MEFLTLFPSIRYNYLFYFLNKDLGLLELKLLDRISYLSPSGWYAYYRDWFLTEPTLAENQTLLKLEYSLTGQEEDYQILYIVTTTYERSSILPDPPVVRNQLLQFALFNQFPLLSFRIFLRSSYITTHINASFCLEHIVLTDLTHRFYIPFNPKISSFKTTILETKTDTIMGNYPFFVRNGNMSYKELSLSGLISREGDYINSFGFHPEILDSFSRESTPTLAELSALTTDENIYYELLHKLAVENWLRNGQWKVLQSPTEGTYIVRLQNVSLSPNEQLARRLHTFSATAIEVAELNEDNLNKMGLSYFTPLN